MLSKNSCEGLRDSKDTVIFFFHDLVSMQQFFLNVVSMFTLIIN